MSVYCTDGLGLQGVSKEQTRRNTQSLIDYAMSPAVSDTIDEEDRMFLGKIVRDMLEHKQNNMVRTTWFVNDPVKADKIGLKGIDLIANNNTDGTNADVLLLAVLLCLVLFGGDLYIQFINNDKKLCEVYAFDMEDAKLSILEKHSLMNSVVAAGGTADPSWTVITNEYHDSF